MPSIQKTARAARVKSGAENLLEVRDLRVDFQLPGGTVSAVRGLDFSVKKGEALAIVGESGCGKSQTLLSILGLLARNGKATGSVLFGEDKTNLIGLDEEGYNDFRGNKIACVFQDSLTGLNPSLKIDIQLEEAAMHHLKLKRSQARGLALESLKQVGIPEPELRLDAYPHLLSGGMRQRVMIAMALICNPQIILADEPTTALDVTIQAQIVALFLQLRQKLNSGLILVTHDLGLAAEICDRMLVMYAGVCVEEGSISDLLERPSHPYTKALIEARIDIDRPDRHLAAIRGFPPNLLHRPQGCAFRPRCDFAQDDCLKRPPLISKTQAESKDKGGSKANGGSTGHRYACWRTSLPQQKSLGTKQRKKNSIGAQELLKVDKLTTAFSIRKGSFWGSSQLVAVRGISLLLREGETLGVVGESGCGKSTLGRTILELEKASAGDIYWRGRNFKELNAKDWRKLRRNLQVIFQDPIASLDPRMSVGSIVAEPLLALRPEIGKKERQKLVKEAMQTVGLAGDMVGRFAHEFSGGQAQRIGIARALICGPQVVICDEPVSALDVSIQAQILALLEDLKQKLKLSLIFISHDLAVVRHISDRIMVLYLGRVVEEADAKELFKNPRHPYTFSLLSAVPSTAKRIRKRAPTGELRYEEVPSPLNPPSGCHFRTRCPFAKEKCALESPPMRDIAGHKFACWFDPKFDK